MPFLEHDGVTRELPPGDTLVGSGSEADWRLQTINLAPRHFLVSVDAAGHATLSSVRAQDVDVNGESLSAPRELAQGDEIIAGAGVFAYVQSLQPAASAAPSTRGYLIDIAGLVAFPLAATPVRIGRDPTSEIVVRDATVARFHAEVRPGDAAPGGPAYTIRSMGAAGSTVNGSLIGGAPRPLAEGDLIRLGTTTLRFTTAAPPAAARVVTRSESPPAAARTRLPPLPQRSPEPTSSPLPSPSASPSPTLADTLRAAVARPRNVVIALVVVVILAAMALLRGGGHSP